MLDLLEYLKEPTPLQLPILVMTNNLHTSECNENKFLFFKINLHHYFLPFSTNHNKKNNSLKTISYMKQHKEYTKNKQIK